MTNKKNKKYIFWARRLSDVDHMVPVIYSLIKNGISPQSIRYIALMPDKTQKSIFTDPRIQFLKDLGINFESLSKNYFIGKISFFQIKQTGNYFILKVISAIYSRFFYRLIKFIYYINVCYISGKYKNRGVFIFDHGTSKVYVNAIKQARRNNIISVTIPHGFVLHRGMINKKHHGIIFSENSALNIFDHIVFSNEVSLSYHELQEKKVRIIGSARYTKEWCRKLSQIFVSANEIRDESKLNVLFFAEKTGMNFNGEWIPWIDEVEIDKILKNFSDDPKINLIIKFHPSIKSSAIYDEYVCKKVIDDSEYNSFQLVKAADVVMATCTSALMNVFLLDKIALIPVYASPFKLVFREFSLDCAISSHSELIDKINMIKTNTNFVKEQSEFYKKFLAEFTKEENQSVLDDYFSFLYDI